MQQAQVHTQLRVNSHLQREPSADVVSHCKDDDQESARSILSYGGTEEFERFLNETSLTEQARDIYTTAFKKGLEYMLASSDQERQILLESWLNTSEIDLNEIQRFVRPVGNGLYSIEISQDEIATNSSLAALEQMSAILSTITFGPERNPPLRFGGLYNLTNFENNNWESLIQLDEHGNISLLGTILVTKKTEDLIQFSRIAANPYSKGNGVGTIMFKKALEYYIELKGYDMYLEARVDLAVLIDLIKNGFSSRYLSDSTGQDRTLWYMLYKAKIASGIITNNGIQNIRFAYGSNKAVSRVRELHLNEALPEFQYPEILSPLLRKLAMTRSILKQLKRTNFQVGLLTNNDLITQLGATCLDLDQMYSRYKEQYGPDWTAVTV